MSSVPVYAITTSCRSADCTHSWPYNSPKAMRPPNISTAEPAGTRLKPPTANQGRPRSYSNSSDGLTPTSPPPLDEQNLRSSSLSHLDLRSHTKVPKSPLAAQGYRERERIMDILGVFN